VSSTISSSVLRLIIRWRSSAPTRKLTPRIPTKSPCGELLQTARLYQVDVKVLRVDEPVTVLVLVTGYVDVKVLNVEVPVVVLVLVTG